MKSIPSFRLKRPHTLSLKIILTFLLVIILATSIISVIFYVQAAKYINSQNEIHNKNVTKNISNGIDRYMEDMDRISKIVIGNPEIQRILSEGQTSGYPPEQKLKDFEYITNLVLSFTSIRDSFHINLYNKNKTLYYYTGLSNEYVFGNSLDDTTWFTENEKSIHTEGSFIIPPYPVGNEKSPRLFGIIRALKKIDNNEIMGYITITSDVRLLNNIIYDNDAFSGSANIEIVDANGAVLNSVNMMKGSNKEIEKMERVQQTSELTGWTTVISLPSSYSLNGLVNVESVRSYILWISVLVIVGSSALAVILSRQLTKPLRHIIKSMRLVRQGNFNIVLEENGLDSEVRQLYIVFNTMILEIKKLITNISDEKLLAKTAQIEALQFQITPHFLYNTLQTMEAFGEIKDVPEIQTMAQSLGKLFRYNIHGNRTVPLYEELEQITTYFTIERIRYREKIICDIKVSGPLRHYMILKFVLQPIVENAILHGFKNIDYQGIVSIEGGLDDNRLILFIKDNGRGMSRERLSFINEKLQLIRTSSQDDKISGIVGIFNVHKRLVSYYGPDYGLQLEAGIHSGTVVKLTIPIVID